MGKESEIDESLVWAAYLDSMEGISTPTLPDEEQALPRIVGLDKLNTIFEWLGSILPGVALAIALALGSRYLSQWIGSSLFDMERSPVSSIMIVILLGMLIRNLVGLPDVYRKGLTLCLRKILRIGIAMLGIRLSILAAGKIGLVTLPVIVVCIVSALFLVSWANKLLGLSRKLGSLIAVGTSICGVSAIIATSSAIDADEDETSYAVTCITIFGMTALLVYPMTTPWLFAGDATLSGMFLGTAIHDTAQVVGAGLMHQQQHGASETLTVATVTKLTRNLFMIGVIPIMAWFYHHHDSRARISTQKSWYHFVPLSVFGFVAMTLVRTVGDMGEKPFGLLSLDHWNYLVDGATFLAGWCISIAMAAVGLGTSLTRFKELGLKPLTVGLVAAVLIGVISFSLLKVISLMITSS